MSTSRSGSAGSGRRPLRLAPGDAGEVEAEGQAIGQGLGNPGVVALPFVEEDEADPRRRPRGQPVALRPDLAGVQGGGEAGGGAGREALRHRHDHAPAIRLGQEAGLGDGAPGGQGRGEVEPAEEAVVGDARRHPAEGPAGSEFAGETVEPEVPHRAGPGPDDDTAANLRIGGDEARHAQGAGPGGAHRARRSSTARATRAVEPDSSRGLRRNRWRRAEGAIRARWSRPTVSAPS
jgi:hypothetical protein